VDAHESVIYQRAFGTENQVFDADHFIASVGQKVVRETGVEIEDSHFHVEDVFQMLKDEPASLFCFVNFQVVPLEHYSVVRGFTQHVHRLLLLIEGEGPRAERESLLDSPGETSSVEDCMVVASPTENSGVNLRAKLEWTLRFLPAQYADVLKPRYFDGRNIVQIAALLNLPECLVAVRLFRGLKHVKDIWDHLGLGVSSAEHSLVR
jgi:hypothetical protein